MFPLNKKFLSKKGREICGGYTLAYLSSARTYFSASNCARIAARAPSLRANKRAAEIASSPEFRKEAYHDGFSFVARPSREMRRKIRNLDVEPIGAASMRRRVLGSEKRKRKTNRRIGVPRRRGSGCERRMAGVARKLLITLANCFRK